MPGQESSSVGVETLNIAELYEVVAQGPAAGAEHDLGYKSGWKSEKVSGSEIRERLSALAVSASSTGTYVHAEAPGPVLSATLPPAADGIIAAPWGRPQSPDTNTGSFVGTWSSLLAPEQPGQGQSQDAGSWDISDAEKLLAMSPTNIKRAVQLPLGALNPGVNAGRKEEDADALSFEAKRHALGATGRQMVLDSEDPLSWQLEDDDNNGRRRMRRGGPMPEVVMPRCAAAEAKAPTLILQPESRACVPEAQSPQRGAKEMGANQDFGTPRAAPPRRSTERVSHSEIRQRLGNLASGASQGAFAPLNLSALRASNSDSGSLHAPRLREAGAFSPWNAASSSAGKKSLGHDEGAASGGAFGPLTPASVRITPLGAANGDASSGAFAPFQARPPSSSGRNGESSAGLGAFPPLETRPPSRNGEAAGAVDTCGATTSPQRRPPASSNGGVTNGPSTAPSLGAFSPLSKVPASPREGPVQAVAASSSRHLLSTAPRIVPPAIQGVGAGMRSPRPVSSSGRAAGVVTVGAFGESVLGIPTAPRNVIMGAPRGALGARHDSVSVVKGVNELAKRKAESLVKEAWMALAGEELENAQELVEQARQEWSRAGKPEGLSIKIAQIDAKLGEKRKEALQGRPEKEVAQHSLAVDTFPEEEIASWRLGQKENVSWRDEIQQCVAHALADGQIVENEPGSAQLPQGWLRMKAHDSGGEYWVNTESGQRMEQQPKDCASADRLIIAAGRLLGENQVACARERLEMALEQLEDAGIRDRDQVCANLHDRITRRAAEMRAEAEEKLKIASCQVEKGDFGKARSLLSEARDMFMDALDERLDSFLYNETQCTVKALQHDIEKKEVQAGHRRKGHEAVQVLKTALQERDIRRARMALVDAEYAYVASGDVSESLQVGPKAQELQNLRVLLEAQNDTRLRGDEALAAARSAFARGDHAATQEQANKARSCYLKAGLPSDMTEELLKPVELLLSQLQSFLQSKQRHVDISESSESDDNGGTVERNEEDGESEAGQDEDQDEDEESHTHEEECYNFTKKGQSPQVQEPTRRPEGPAAVRRPFQRSHVAMAPNAAQPSAPVAHGTGTLVPQPPADRKSGRARDEHSPLVPRPPPARTLESHPPPSNPAPRPPTENRPRGGGRPMTAQALSPVAPARALPGSKPPAGADDARGELFDTPPPAPPPRRRPIPHHELLSSIPHDELLSSDGLAHRSTQHGSSDREADDLLRRRRRNELLHWWKTTALKAAEERKRQEANRMPTDTSVADALAAVDGLLATADKTLLQARTGHAGRVSKVEQAMSHLAKARETVAAARISDRDQVLQDMQGRCSETLKWAKLVEQAHSAKCKAEDAFKDKEWERVVSEADTAIEAFEVAGEMDQVYSMEDMKQRAAQAQARAHHCQRGDEAVKRAHEALKDGQVTLASEQALLATSEYAAAAAGIPAGLKSLLQRISEAVAAAEGAAALAKASAQREQGNQALEDAQACIQDNEFDDARLAIAKARSLFDQANCLDEMSRVLTSLDVMVARKEGRESCLKRARAAFEACKLGVERSAAETDGKAKRAILVAARDECYTAIAGFQEADEEESAAQARHVLADVEQSIRQTNTSAEADAAIAAAEKHLAQLQFDEARREAAQAMLFLAKGGLLEEREAQITELEERIQTEEARQRTRQEIRNSLTLASGATELARVPGKASSLDDARAHLQRAEQLLPQASDKQLEQDVKDAKHGVELAMQWLQELEDGDAEMLDARKHLAAGDLDRAQECGQTALHVFERLDVAPNIVAVRQLLAEVASVRVRANGEEELRKGEEALGDGDREGAHTHARAARELFQEAKAADGVVKAEDLIRRVREAEDRDATVEQGSTLLAEAEAAMNKADFRAARRALSHARAAFLRAAIHDAEQEVTQVELRLDAMEAVAAAVGEARQAVNEAKQCAANLPPDVLAAKFAVQRARAALQRCGENMCAPCMVSEVREVTSQVKAIEEVIQGLLDQQSAQATVATLIQNARACLDREQLDEAEESLGQARQALAQAEDGGGNTLQQVVDMQEELRVVRQEVKYRQEGEQLLGEAEESLRACELGAAERRAQQALQALNKAHKRLRVDKLQQQTHRLELRIADKIGKEAKREQGRGSLEAAEECITERRLDAARVHCAEARDSLVKAGALQDHEGHLGDLEARISQLAALDTLRARVEQAVQFVGRALDVVRVPGKRDAKLAEAKEHLASAVTLHEAMLEVHPSTVASVVGEIVTVGQQVAVDLEQVQTRLAEEEKWALACVAGEKALQAARAAHGQQDLAAAVQHATVALEHFSAAEADESKQAASTFLEQLDQARNQARAQELLAAGEAALSRDDMAAARAAGDEARQAAEDCASIPLVRQVETLLLRVEAREVSHWNREQGLKRLAEAEQAMTDGEYSAARTALGAARSMLEIAKDFEGLERVRELQGRVEAAEASRSSGEAMVEAENALQRADFAAAKAAVAAARSTMLKANQGCEEVDALQRRIDVAERASEALAEAEKLLEEARHRAEVERKFDEAKERIILARAAAEKFVAEQTALMSQEPVTDERVPAADSGLAALLVPDWKEKWDSRVGELAAFLAWLQDMQQKQARAAELLERAQNAFHEDELEQALKLVNEVSQIASTLAESKAEDVKEQGIRIAADAEYLAARIKSAIDGKSAVEEARRALQTGIDLLKEDKLGEATEQAGKVRAALPRITDQEELGQSLNEQTELLEKAINRAYAAEEADAATSEVRERIGAADFEGARAWVIKGADALQRCEMADHQAIVLRMLSQVNSAEAVHRARMQAQELLSETEAALAKEDEPAARRALDAAQRAVDSIGEDALEPDMRERFAKLLQVLGARDEASRCTAVASKALSVVEQQLASEEVEEARQSLTAAGEAVEEASSAAKGRPDLADQVLELRARHARLSECLARGGNRAVARKLAGQHHAAAQRAINAEDTETAAEELACARHQYNVAGDLDSMGEVLDALLQQVEDLRKKLFSDKERQIGDEAIKKFGEVVVQGDFELARSLLDQARAHYETAEVDMSAVLKKLASKLRAAEANAAKHSVGDESLQLAIEQVAAGNLQDAREALNIAKNAYQAAGIELMDDAIRELEADIDAELAQRADQDSATHAPPADASQVDNSSDSSSSHSDEEPAEQPANAEPNGAAAADKKMSGKERFREGKHLWRKAFDPASGEVYYYHTGTKVTQWDRPEEYDSEDDWESSSWGGSERPSDKDEDSFRSASGKAGLLMGGNVNLNLSSTNRSGTSGQTTGIDTMTLNGLDPKTVLEYAVYIGIDPGREAFLLWIAEDGIQAALPPHYSQHADDRGEVYFYNSETKESLWEHPMDEHYRQLVVYWRDAYSRGEKPRESKNNVLNPFQGKPAAEVRTAKVEDDPMNQTVKMAPPSRLFGR